MQSRGLERMIESYMRTIPELKAWMYSDDEYFNPENWPLENTCKKEKYRPMICMLKKGHPGPHISLSVWQEAGDRVLMDCPSLHIYVDKATHQVVHLQCRLKMGHEGFHEAYHVESLILWV